MSHFDLRTALYKDARSGYETMGRPKKIPRLDPTMNVESVEQSWLSGTTGWRGRKEYSRAWRRATSAFIGCMICCAVCGIVVFGIEPTYKSGNTPGLPQAWAAVHSDVPEYPFAAPHLIGHMNPTGSTDSDTWFHCRNCMTKKGVLSSVVSNLDGHYQAALADVPPILLQGLSCVDSAFQIREKYAAFATGTPLIDSYHDSPLVSDALSAVSTGHVNNMRAILADSILHNPVIAKFQTVWESTDFLAEFPVLALEDT